MEIVKEDVDDLNAVLKVKITPSDYIPRYNNAIKKHQKKIDLPGFRTGKVPADIVKKRFGKYILAEEINDMLSELLHKYISENKIEILGAPLPKENTIVDFDNLTEFEFQYELGLAPKISIELSEEEKIPYYIIKPNEELVNKRIDYLRRSYGQVVHPEITEEQDILTGIFTQVDKEGNIIPGGIFKTTQIAISKIVNAENKTKLIGLKKEDEVILENLQDDAHYVHEIFRIPSDKLEGLSLRFQLKNITRIVPAELDQKLFDKIYNPEEVSNETEFRNKVSEELNNMLVADSNSRFMNDAMKLLLKKANLSLPEEFLKKYLLATSKEKISPEQVEKEYRHYSDIIKWQLIENYLLKKYDITVTTEEVEQYITNKVKTTLIKFGIDTHDEKFVQKLVKKQMADKERVDVAYELLYDQKLVDLFKNIFLIEKREVTYDEFFK